LSSLLSGQSAPLVRSVFIIGKGVAFNLLSLGQTNLERTYHNISNTKNVINAMKPIRQDAIIVVVSNPVDLLTSLVVDISGLPESQIIGSGTFLDSVRLRRLLADRMGVSLGRKHMHLCVVNKN
jgi:L-lactate dehydrogenase